MKIATDVNVGVIGDTRRTRVYTIDVSNDVIKDSGDLTKRIYQLKDENVIQPAGIWMNINQAYVLAKEFADNTDEETDPKKLEEMAWNFQTFRGINIWIHGRDVKEQS